MGLFDLLKTFQQNRKENHYRRCGDTLKNMITNKDQRTEAIENLREAPAEYAIPQLLKRFEIVIDHGIQDAREKDLVCDIIVKHGEKAKVLVTEKLKGAKRISWLIKLAEKIFSADEFKNLIAENLNENVVEFDDTSLERNTELLLAMKEHVDERFIEKARVFVKSRDENVRMAAVEVLESHATTFPVAKQHLIELAKEIPSDDNSRFLGVLKSILQRNNWS